MTASSLSEVFASAPAAGRSSVGDGLADGALRLSGRVVLEGLASNWSLAGRSGPGVFLRWTAPADEQASYHETILGRIKGLVRFTSAHRFVPFWLRPVAGVCESEVRRETLWLLAELAPSEPDSRPDYLLLVPLLSKAGRHALFGSTDGLTLSTETGDPAVPCESCDAVFVGMGDDPYRLLEQSARAVSRRIGIGRLRREKATPDFVDDFGWCTWDAFYKTVSPDGVLAGLQAFAAGGVSPRMVILDDGWQSTRRAQSGEEYLSSFSPNAKFGGDLGELVGEVKRRFGVRKFFVWHALLGYWGGLDPAVWSADYGVRIVPRGFGPGVLHQDPSWNAGPWGGLAGVPAAKHMAAFYNDYHELLAAQGVDGVKVDAQAMLEAFGFQQGGRIPLALAARRGLEASARRHFDGRLINCMSATGECAYLAEDSVLLRTSDDFWPDRPETHGAHLYTNVQVSLWMGEFMLPDWDMFQSAHERGGYHAAARAISGGPVYVSDMVGKHDFALLRKLVLGDGTILRADLPARPSPESLFVDPTREAVALKIFNFNGDCGVLGLFDARSILVGEKHDVLSCAVSCVDLPGLPEVDHVVWTHRENQLRRLSGESESFVVKLRPDGWELVTFAPIERGFAAIGLAEKLNSSGAITARRWCESAGMRECRVTLRGGGCFLGWSFMRPDEVSWRGVSVPFVHDLVDGRLSVDLCPDLNGELAVRWQTEVATSGVV
ncbi:MAG: Sip1-related alpha-galactosidase [Opitutaceae bacterium]|jgi:raffinose synthase